MVLDELERKKEEIIENHKERMIQINEELLKRIDNGLKERETGADAGVNALGQLKALFHISTNKGLRMNSEQRIALAKMYFDIQKTTMDEIMNDGREGYHSLLTDVNEEIEIARDELRQIEEELKHIDGNIEKEKDLKERKREAMREYDSDL
jgi:hypothetical protein